MLDALTSPFISKYAEGYPGKRYYGGCEHADGLENYVCELACNLFRADHANVQPHSGTQANMAVYQALLEPGDTILSLSLSDGGHLSHGSPASFSGLNYKVVHYAVEDIGYGDYSLSIETIERAAAISRPKLIVIGGSSLMAPMTYEFYEQIRDLGLLYNVPVMADIAHIAGPIAAGLLPNPTPYVDIVTSTTQKTLRGPRGGFILCKKYYAKKIDRAVFPGIQGGPHMNTIAAKGVCFQEADTPDFAEYQDAVMQATHNFSMGTGKNFKYKLPAMPHMVLIDVKNEYGITGAEAQERLEEAGIIVNKQMLPGDTHPQEPSGIRIGFAAAVTRDKHFPAEKMRRIIEDILTQGVRSEHKKWISDYTRQHPLYDARGYYNVY